MSYNREQNFVRTQAKPLRPKPRQQQGHFDPEELTRRLYIVLADQKAHAERKRARADEAKSKDARSWISRHHNKEAAERSLREAARETGTAHPSKQSSLKPPGSASSGELKKQKASKLDPHGKEAKPNTAKNAVAPKVTPEPAPAGYHHVPQEAAKQFQRTTTVDGMRDNNSSSSSNLAHKLSRQALKLHLAAGAAAHSSSLRPVAGEDKAISPVERLLKDRERVDDWRSRIPEEAAEVESEREEFHVAPQYQQHTFHAELARLRPAEHPDQNRRNSTGDILARAAEDNRLSMVLVERTRTPLLDALEEATPSPEPDPATADEHRVDWTQSDEQAAAAMSAAANAPAQRHKPLLSPLLRKADSIWTLRGRLGSGSKGSAGQEKGDMAQIPESPRSPKEPRAGFFAKFKR